MLKEFGIKIWNRTRNIREIKIVNKIFDISSIKVLFTNLKKLRNSIENNINNEAKNRTKPRKVLDQTKMINYSKNIRSFLTLNKRRILINMFQQ